MTTTTISKTIFVNAARETVWSFLTDKDKLGEWYHPAEADLAENADYVLFARNDDGTKKRQVWGRVVEMDQPSRLVTTFIIEPFNGAETIVTWALENAAGGTRLSLTHEGIAEAADKSAIQFLTALDAGWDNHLGRLRESVK